MSCKLEIEMCPIGDGEEEILSVHIAGPFRRSNVSVPPRLPPRNDALSEEHYKDIYRLVKKSSRLSETTLKFLWHMVLYVIKIASFAHTVITGDDSEGWFTILFYFITCVVTAVVIYANQALSKSEEDKRWSLRRACGKLFLNMLTVTKPVRYMKMFWTRKTLLKLIEEDKKEGKFSRQSMKALVQLKAKELDDEQVNLYETFFQSIPMTVLQTYLLFQAHQKFQLCSTHDLSRIGLIITAGVHAASSVVTYETAKLDFEHSLHFLGYMQSNGRLDMLLYKHIMLKITAVTSFLMHCATIAQRLYTAFFFMVISPYLTFLYFGTLFLINLILLHVFPQHLLDVHQNAPHGVHTLLSYLADGFINIFCNHGTRFNKYTNKVFFKGRFFSFRFPLVLIQFFTHMMIPLGLVYITKYQYGMQYVGDHSLSSSPSTTLNETLSSCPEVALVYSLSPTTREMGNWLFSSYKSLDDRLHTFNDVFTFRYLHWLLFYIQIVFAVFLYGYADLTTKTRTVTRSVGKGATKTQVVVKEVTHSIYPVLMSYSFYRSLLREVLSIPRDIWQIRKLMWLTLIEEDDFYREFRCTGLYCSKSNFDTSKRWQDMVKEPILCIDADNVKRETDRIMNMEGLTFLKEFKEIRRIIEKNGIQSDLTEQDKKLFYGFVNLFDTKLAQLMSSDRIVRIFDILGIPEVHSSGNEWERSG